MRNLTLTLTLTLTLALAVGCPSCETDPTPTPDDAGMSLESDATLSDATLEPDAPTDWRHLEPVSCSSAPPADFLGCYGDDVVCVDDVTGELSEAEPVCQDLFGTGDAEPACFVGLVQVSATVRCLSCITAACRGE